MSAKGTPAPRSLRRLLRWLLPLCAAAALAITLLADQTRALTAIERGDIIASDAVASVSISRLLTDFGDRLNECTYRWLVICEPKPELGLLQSFQASQAAAPAHAPPPWLALLILIPRLPDALIHVAVERWGEGPLAFGALIVFLVMNVLIVRYFFRDGGPLLWILAGAGVPVVASIACLALKYAFLFAAHGVLVVVQLLIWIGGIVAGLYWLAGTFLQGKEVVQTAKEFNEIRKL